ncbi:hypothetical protein D3C79_897360 [compost metagenome]
MTGKGHARIVDHPFMNRPGNQRSKFAAQATIAGARQRIHHVMTVPGAELARDNRRAEWNGQQRERTSLLRKGGVVRVIRQ